MSYTEFTRDGIVRYIGDVPTGCVSEHPVSVNFYQMNDCLMTGCTELFQFDVVTLI